MVRSGGGRSVLVSGTGALWGTQVWAGRYSPDGLRARDYRWPPLRRSGWAASPDPSVSFLPACLPTGQRGQEVSLRFIGLDVHRDFCDVAI